MEKFVSDSFFSGLSGLQLPIPKHLFPSPFKDSSRLTYYASLFNSIEINSTFYKIPQEATVAKWAASVRKQFKFTFKLWKEITHSKGFTFSKSDVWTFFKAINSVEDQRGCILIQLPPGVGKEYIPQLEELLGCMSEVNTSWNIAIEFRNKTWYNDATYKLLNLFNAALVVHDMPGSATPEISHVSDFMYIRFHGPTGNYRDSYSQVFLMEYSSYIMEFLTEGKEVYVYFNNTMGDAFNNLKTINNAFQISASCL